MDCTPKLCRGHDFQQMVLYCLLHFIIIQCRDFVLNIHSRAKFITKCNWQRDALMQISRKQISWLLFVVWMISDRNWLLLVIQNIDAVTTGCKITAREITSAFTESVLYMSALQIAVSPTSVDIVMQFSFFFVFLFICFNWMGL